jgi:hypothetical protein
VNKGVRVLIGALVVGLLLFSVSCVTIDMGFESVELDELQRITETIALDDADEVRADVRIGAGELVIDGNAGDDALMEAEFIYNVSDWEPEVRYENGRLVVRQPNSRKLPFDEGVRYEWNLSFHEGVPLELRVDYGAGDGELDLGDLAITELDMKLGAGDAQISFEGNETLERMELDMGAGNIEVDLRGEWEDDVNVAIQGGIGSTNLILPGDIGVEVDVTKGIGSVRADDFDRSGNVYRNEAYGETEATIYVTIQAGVGDVRLDLD